MKIHNYLEPSDFDSTVILKERHLIEFIILPECILQFLRKRLFKSNEKWHKLNMPNVPDFFSDDINKKPLLNFYNDIKVIDTTYNQSLAFLVILEHKDFDPVYPGARIPEVLLNIQK